MDEIQQVGVSHFHFSLNWSSLVPTGDVAHPNTTLLGYYRCFTRQLLQANVTPVVTLWHHTRQCSSLPAPLNTANKWLNRLGSGFMVVYTIKVIFCLYFCTMGANMSFIYVNTSH